MAQTMSLLIRTFLKNPKAMGELGSLLTYDSVAVPNSLCKSTKHNTTAGVLEATLCSGFEAAITPLPSSNYTDTACNWASQKVRPMLLP